MKEVEQTLRDRMASLVMAMGYEFVGCEWAQQDRRRVLRIYIDTLTGLTIADCSQVSRQLSAVLDVEELIQGPYLLEVSSPGIDRPLFEMAHYQKQIGQRMKLRLRAPVQNRRLWTGQLLRIEEEQLHFLVDGEEVVFPYSNIEKGNVIANIHLSSRSEA